MLRFLYFLLVLTVGHLLGRDFKRIIPVSGSNKAKDLQRMGVVTMLAILLWWLSPALGRSILWHNSPITALVFVSLFSLGIFMGVFALRHREEDDLRQDSSSTTEHKNRL